MDEERWYYEVGSEEDMLRFHPVVLCEDDLPDDWMPRPDTVVDSHMTAA